MRVCVFQIGYRRKEKFWITRCVCLCVAVIKATTARNFWVTLVCIEVLKYSYKWLFEQLRGADR